MQQQPYTAALPSKLHFVDHKEIIRISRETIIPFMQECGSTDLRVDCLKTFYHPEVLSLYESHGIRVYPSAGHPQNVYGGYPPKSHDFMPNEGIHAEIKKRAWKTSQCSSSSQAIAKQSL